MKANEVIYYENTTLLKEISQCSQGNTAVQK
jgi:hypothetical protein